jgi:hypothetical protein
MFITALHWWGAVVMFLCALLYAGIGSGFAVFYAIMTIAWAGLALFRMMYLDR